MCNGFVEKKDKKTWQLTPFGQAQQVNLPEQISQDIAAIVKQYGKLSSLELINTVYANYSWFTVNSDLSRKPGEKRPVADQAIYTAGYEGKTVDEFLNLLMRSGIRIGNSRFS